VFWVIKDTRRVIWTFERTYARSDVRTLLFVVQMYVEGTIGRTLCKSYSGRTPKVSNIRYFLNTLYLIPKRTR
jgi:hypothetical protein